MSVSTTTIVTRPGATVQIHRLATRQPRCLPADLVDCSRAEVQFRVTGALAAGERIVVRLRHGASGLQLDMAGAVDWQRQDADGQWIVGCRFAEELDWETLGEMFLSGILDTTPRQSDSASPSSSADGLAGRR